MNALAITALMILAPASKEPRLEDGFYEVRQSGDGVHFPGNDGRTLLLGNRLGRGFGKATIQSRNNDNTEFSCTLTGADQLWDGPEPLALALVVDNLCLRLSGYSIPGPEGKRDLRFTIVGLEPARRVAKSLQCEVRLRSDPGHRLRAKWTPVKESFAIGEDVVIRFELKNVGKEAATFRIGGQQRGSRDNQYRFIAQSSYGMGKGVPDTGDPNNFGGKSWTKTLKPGESYTTEVPVHRWFKFDAPDLYRITGIWSLHLEDPAREGFFDRGLWDDLVCGECIVRVEEAKKK